MLNYFYGFHIGAKEVDEQDDIYILVAPQNAVGNCIIGVSTLSLLLPEAYLMETKNYG